MVVCWLLGQVAVPIWRITHQNWVSLPSLDKPLPGTEGWVWCKQFLPPLGAAVLLLEAPPCWLWGEKWQHPSLSSYQTMLFRHSSQNSKDGWPGLLHSSEPSKHLAGIENPKS